ELAERVVRDLDMTNHPELDPQQQKTSLFDIKGMVSQFDIRSLLPISTPEDFEDSTLSEAEIFDRVVDKLTGRIQVTPVAKTQLVKISVEMADPKLAAAAANALANAYIESQLEAKLSMSKMA